MKKLRYTFIVVIFIAMFGCKENMNIKCLNRQEYLSTFSGPNQSIGTKKYDSEFVWPYVKKVPKTDYPGLSIAWGYVPFVYRTSDGKFDHIFVSTKTSNVFLLIIKNNENGTILGHHLLDLNEEYGIKE